VVACSQSSDETNPIEDSEPGISLSAAQQQEAAITAAKLERIPVRSFVKVTGEIAVPPNNLANIHMVVPAYVRQVHVLPGDVVSKGAALVDLYHPDIVKMQSDYQVALAELARLEAELERKGRLDGTNIVSQKDLLTLQTQRQITASEVSSIESSLEAINISTQKVRNGSIQKQVTITSPIAGTVSSLNINKGMLVSPDLPMLSIVDTQHKHLELNVYPTEAQKIEPGMEVLFTTNAYPQEEKATIYLVNKNVNQDNIVMVHCHLESESLPFIIGDFAEAKIVTDADSVYAIGNEEIINESGKKYLFYKDGNRYYRTEVITGKSDDLFTEIRGPKEIFNRQVVTRGNYYLNANW
jgi:cobalt-zinc-cadmium efflux system membrane fusion protein